MNILILISTDASLKTEQTVCQLVLPRGFICLEIVSPRLNTCSDIRSSEHRIGTNCFGPFKGMSMTAAVECLF